jgi:hypothetical protein
VEEGIESCGLEKGLGSEFLGSYCYERLVCV